MDLYAVLATASSALLSGVVSILPVFHSSAMIAGTGVAGLVTLLFV